MVVGFVAWALAPWSPARGATAREPGPFRGLGAWVDAFDYAPAFQSASGPVAVTPDSVEDMAALGAKTLYLQAAMNDSRSPGKIIDERLVGEFLSRAHREGMEVVAWYYPTLTDVAADLAHVEALVDFRHRGQRFDALALDIESTQTVRDVDDRNSRVVKLAAKSRELVGDEQPLAAIVYPAVQIEVVNPTLWPRFPYKRLGAHVDVWMPMAYWTFRDGVHRDPYVYTAESVTRLRENLGDRRALVHPIGGIADVTTTKDYEAFMRAVRDTRSVGWSVYDFATTMSSAWPRLRPGALSAPTTTTTAGAAGSTSASTAATAKVSSFATGSHVAAEATASR